MGGLIAVGVIAATTWWSMTAKLTMAVPNSGFREATGANATWGTSMRYTKSTV